jgi:hypothetical protein
MLYLRKSACILATLAALAACEEDGTGPEDGTATVQGSVEETTPAASASGASLAQAGPQMAPGTDAETVAVVEIDANGSFTELASAEVEADGSFSVEEVPAGRSDLAVVAYVGDRVAGQVLIHERTTNGAVVVTAPINYETTVEARAYSEMRASGRGSASTASEVSLFIHMQGPEAEAVATSDAEVEAVAEGVAVASSTLTALYASSGTALDAAARGDLIAEAAVEFAADRSGGASLEDAHEAFMDAALEALIEGGASLESTVIASAGAATTLDATVAGRSEERAAVIGEAVRVNLRARERLAASFSSTGEGSVATAIAGELTSARASVGVAGTVTQLGAAIDAALSAVIEVAIDGAVELLAADATSAVRAEVEARAAAALDVALLDARLESATTAEAAAEAVADYRAEVRATVEAMIEAAGATGVDAEVMTSLFVAACAGGHVH